MRNFTKTLISILTCLLISTFTFGQSPEAISYQAIIRNANNALVANTQVGMQISILQTSAEGMAIYTETHQPITNVNGLVAIEIGEGTSSGDFTAIDWSMGPYFLKTETDPEGGTNYTITGVSQLLSVAYALHAKTAQTATNVAITGKEIAFIGWDKDASDDFNGDYNSLTNTPELSNYDTDASDDFSGSFNDLSDVPEYLDINSQDDFNGDYNHLVNKPDLFSGSYNDLTNVPENLDTDATDDFSGSFNDLVDVPVNFGVDFDGKYSSLTGTPKNVSEFTNDKGYLTSETDGDVSNEIQDLYLDGNHILTITNNGSAREINLNAYLDNTDSQTAEEVSVSISGNLTSTDVQSALVELQSELDTKTDNQNLSLSNNTLTIENGNSVDLNAYLDNTDSQTAEEVSVSISGNLTSTDVQSALVELQSELDTKTDNQNLSLSNNTLTIENGNSVDLNAYLDNTDSQTASDVSVSISGNLTSTDVQSALVELQSELDTKTDDQSLILSDNTLAIENGNSVDLSAYLTAEDISGIADNAQAIKDTASQIRADISQLIDEKAPVGTQTGEMQYWDGSAWKTIQPGYEGASLSLVNGVPTWVGGISYPVVETGQVKFFDNKDSLSSAPVLGDAFYGQDAHYDGNEASYTDNGDGTVTDNVTGLMWEKGFRRSTFSDQQGYADTVSTGGYTDWRVPSTKELYSLINFTGNQGSGNQTSPGEDPPSDAIPFIDTTYFDFEYPSDADLRYIDAQYLVSTEYVGTVMNNEDAFFGVNFADGRIKGYPQTPQQTRTWYLKLVRGNTAYGENKFTDNNNGTISDHATGLMWSEVDSGDAQFASFVVGSTNQDGSLNWEEALDFVASINSGAGYVGYKDWRLPNAKELHSIVDYSRAPDVTSSPAIDEMFETTQIESEVEPGKYDDYPFFWTSTTFEPGQDAVIIQFGRSWGKDNGGNIVDVHGAGGQRTDDKTGNPSWFGPQNDLNRVYNHVRLVRDM